MSSRRSGDKQSASIGPALAILMRDEGWDVDTAARHIKDRSTDLGISMADVAASIVAADAARSIEDPGDSPG